MKAIFLITITLISICSFAQDTTRYWTAGGLTNVSFSQVMLKNWVGGGQNSVALNTSANLFCNYKKAGNSWDNNINLGYGIIKQGDKGRFLKNDDRLDLTSKYGTEIAKNLSFSMLVNFRSQLTKGYNYPNDSVRISEFLSPAYVLLAAGIDYKPSEAFSFFLSPVTGKLTIVNNRDLADAGAFGVDPAVYDNGILVSHGERFRKEFGGLAKISIKKEIMKNVLLQTQADFFANYLKDLGNIDVNWELNIAMKINKLLTATVSTNLIYDDDIAINIDDNDDGVAEAVGPRTQFREVFGLGVSYKF